MQAEKQSLTLLIGYWTFQLIVSWYFPHLEASNGSPYSLIFFTVAFIFIFIVPTMVGILLMPLATSLKWKLGISYGRRSLKHLLEVLHIIYEQKIVVLIISGFVFLMFAFDGDATCLIRYVMKGSPCWPVLIPHQQRDKLPYPLQHAWIKSWHLLFSDYSPGSVLTFMQSLGRELGEVCRLLPVLIGMYVASLFVVPHKHTVLRLTIFACVAGVVLGGVTSGSFKILFHRYRPNAYGDPYRWTGPGTAVVNHLSFSKLDLSFPAGHTTVTSAVATCLYIAIMQSVNVSSLACKMFLVFLLYMFPLAVLVSRVGDCYHWTSDAAFGVG